LVPRGWFIEGGGHNGSYFRRNLFMNTDDTNSIVKLRNDFNNKDVYTTVLSYDTTNQNTANKYGPFYVDLDHKDFSIVRRDALLIISYLENIYQIPKKLMNLYYSGNKGVHIIIEPEVFGYEASVDLHNIFRLLAEELAARTTEYEVTLPNGTTRLRRTLDLGIYDCRRLFRLNNSINSKSGLRKVQITYDELANASEEEIKAIASTESREMIQRPFLIPQAKRQFQTFADRWQTKHAKRKDPGEVSGRFKDVETPPCVVYLLNNYTAEGSRNETGIVLASFLYQHGMNSEEAYLVMESWGLTKCDPPMEEKDIQALVTSAYKGGYPYGCRSLKRVSQCDESKCTIRRASDD
jgi:hypothetical protein